MTIIDGVVYLAKCAINEQIPDKKMVDSLDLDAVYREASRHMIGALVGMALKDCGVETTKFKQVRAAALQKMVILNYETEKVFLELDKAGIWHMPLKGSVIKDWYPRFGMRESADVDVLFDKECEEKVRDIMLSLGFVCDFYGGGHTDNYHKQPMTVFEMHVNLFGPAHRRVDNTYYENVKDSLIRKRDCEYAFTPEDYYIYHIAHTYKHFSSAGTGLRSIIDTFVILRRFDLNWDYVIGECRKLGISEFEENNRMLAVHLFGDGQLSPSDREMFEYIVSSGTFGSIEHSVRNGIKIQGGKIRYLMNRIILPMEMVQAWYPTFYRHKVLLPLLPIYRVVHGIKRKKRRWAAELNSIRNA